MNIKKLYKLNKILKELKNRGFCVDIILEGYINKVGSIMVYRPVLHNDPAIPHDVEMNFNFLLSYDRIRFIETRIYNKLDIIRAPNTSIVKQRVTLIRDIPFIKELNRKLNDLLVQIEVKNL